MVSVTPGSQKRRVSKYICVAIRAKSHTCVRSAAKVFPKRVFCRHIWPYIWTKENICANSAAKLSDRDLNSDYMCSDMKASNAGTVLTVTPSFSPREIWNATTESILGNDLSVIDSLLIVILI